MYTQKRVYLLSLLIFVAICSHFDLSWAQEKTTKQIDMTAYKKMSKSFYDKKIDETFAPIEEWKCITGAYFDLNKTNSPTVIFLGFSSCAPCKQALPIYSAVSLEEKYSQYNFLYMTFDDSVSVFGEFESLKIPVKNRIKIISLPEKYIDENGIAHGYPAVYFLNSEAVVKLIYAYGELDGSLNSKQYWDSLLDSLH